ncbi:Polyadenylate-binding protein-interacting protein 7 [Heracleum sosnowskyi]|uniref:Polyadenylate-binding protein-interacting protein 7 n=1 Tax=Heracleum sosnowskyi TaxID=360622 RepID=A0AAD8HLI9_9APIA|nr:Polyadenylate-binding protein-interacting protein 7 [Heracleum sosnowskyi]
MSLYNNMALTSDKRPSTIGKVTSLNPNAVEFVPSSLRSSPANTSAVDVSSISPPTSNIPLRKTGLNRSESSVSNKSDEEARQYWSCQLPDDIIPDFNVVGEDDSTGIDDLPFSDLSLIDVNERARLPGASTGSNLILKEQNFSPHRINGGSYADKMGFSAASYRNAPSSVSYPTASTKPWDRQILNNDHQLNSVSEGPLYNRNSGHEFLDEMSTESLAEVYFSSGGDLNLTVEMLTQLELQVESELNQNLNLKAMSAPNLGAHDFPALAEGHSGASKYSVDEFQQSFNPYRASDKENHLLFKSSSSIPSRGPTDFASAVRKMASQDTGMWKYDRSAAADVSIGSSRSSNVLASAYNGAQGRAIHGDRLQGRSLARAAPVWLETGDTVANMYSETREEARDYARLRNVYFEQAQQAYLVGNKALAKELSMKGQLHNMQMKAAHAKAQDSIYRQRNPLGADIQGNGRGQERVIDLHGLHVSEAIHILKRDLTVLRSAARSVDQRWQVYICVGTGHHTRGSRTPSRLPTAVQLYLLEEEGLDFSEPQPGLLRVVLY